MNRTILTAVFLFASAGLAAAQGVDTAAIAQAAQARGAKGEAIGKAVEQARVQAVAAWLAGADAAPQDS